MLVIIGGVLLFIGAIFGLIILINAFKESAGQGLLCMFVPFYIFYFAFARYSGSKKGLVVGSWLSTYLVGTALVVVGTLVAANDAVATFEQDLQNMPEMGQAPMGDTAGAAGDSEGGEVVSCDLSQQPGRICSEYSLSGRRPSPAVPARPRTRSPSASRASATTPRCTTATPTRASTTTPP